MQRAASSLPVPVSPVISTGLGLGATRAIELADVAHAGQGEEHVLRRPRLADLFAEKDVLRPEAFQLQRAANHALEVLVVEGLEDEVRRALAHRLDRGLRWCRRR